MLKSLNKRNLIFNCKALRELMVKEAPTTKKRKANVLKIHSPTIICHAFCVCFNVAGTEPVEGDKCNVTVSLLTVHTKVFLLKGTDFF